MAIALLRSEMPEREQASTIETVQPTWLTAEEAAALLRVHVTTVHDMCKRGELQAMKAGRDWRIHPQGLQAREVADPATSKLMNEAAELAATKAATLVLKGLVSAIQRELAHQQFELAMPR